MRIETNLPAFQNDIGDVVRLFYGEGAVSQSPEADSGECLIHRHIVCDGQWEEQVTLQTGGRETSMTLAGPAVTGTPVEEKRALKRLIKRAAYQLLKQAEDRILPWGSLTGIRPCRLFRQQMEQGRTREEARAVFASEFDVSPSRIDLVEEVLGAQENMPVPGPNEMDLYIGIPFCTTRCSYCSFSSGLVGDGHLVGPYLDALTYEIEATAKLVQTFSLQVRTAYIGGGTPTSLNPAQLDTLLSCVAAQFPNLTEWTVEAGRPDTLDREKLSILRQYPVTRISINPQSMNDETLQRIGRAHTAEETVRMYHLAREMGFDDINMDIITALPGEDLSMFRHTLEEIRKLRPDSLTVHTLAMKHSSKLHEQQYAHPREAMFLEMADSGRTLAHELGMRAYYLYRQKYMASNLENVGYALPGKACRYNVDNMEETASVLAVGAGGISKRLFGRDERIARAPNVSNIEVYIERVQEMVRRKEEMLSKDSA